MSITTSEAPKPTESARRQKTRERLMDAAFEVFSEVGIHAATVEMIAERADFTRGAFYSNFDTKEELFLALAERGNNQRLALLRQSVEHMDQILPEILGAPGAKLQPENLGLLVTSFLDQQNENSYWFLFQSELRLLAMRDPAVGSIYLEQKAAAETEFANIISAALRAVGLSSELNPLELASVLTTTYESTLQEAIMQGGPQVQKIAHELVRTKLVALITQLAR
ncbi:AcrR family transcriptional regulator [Aurantimicrobium minutum]|uniref:TetR/AcrR family transcriptional regulator n=1 Tax=Aurantimicrobium minutum TaxID=708131 RepID=UPI0024742C9E|nr:helix-turn-helix domain-containing protein [Aurantimicrobium minutum]MDH6532776.1 AcrR family transcriptional regulator [Aurantimicrobium minutum]